MSDIGLSKLTQAENKLFSPAFTFVDHARKF